MENITFEQLPKVLMEMKMQLNRIEGVLGNFSSVSDCEKPLNIKEAAEFLNLAISTIYGKVSNDDIPHTKRGKHLYFNKSDLVNWVKTGKRKTNIEWMDVAGKLENNRYFNKKRRR